MAEIGRFWAKFEKKRAIFKEKWAKNGRNWANLKEIRAIFGGKWANSKKISGDRMQFQR
jgi:hypothetical protein